MKKIFLFLMVACATSAFSQQAQENTAGKASRMKPALLVIDVQNAFLPMMDQTDKELPLYVINALIELFRQQGYPVVRIYASDKDYGPKPDTEPFEFPSSVLIKPDDPKVVKYYGDGFNKTDLDKILREKGCNTVFLCGLSAVGCVLATYVGAENHDYKAFLIKDALLSHKSAYTDQIEDIFGAIGYDVVKVMLENAQK